MKGKGTASLSKVPTQYGDEDFLNVPCISLEDCPTANHKVDSELGDVLEAVQGHIETANRNKKPKN
jgi:hypothetical protein